MPKKIKHESFKYAFLNEALKIKLTNSKDRKLLWLEFLDDLTFQYNNKEIKILWIKPMKGSISFSIDNVLFYKKKKKDFFDTNSSTSTKNINQKYFENAVLCVAKKTKFYE